MKRKIILTTASVLALAGTSLFAQMTTTEETTTTSTPTSETTTTETTTTYAPGQIIMDSKGAEIGKVERVITRETGGPRLVVVNTGARTVLVPPSVLNVTDSHITYTGSTEVISTAPVWEESTVYTTREAVAPIYKHYNVEMEIEEADD